MAVVIIGTGLAGYNVAKFSRALDSETQLTILTQDDGAFYSKPLLSNAFAKNKSATDLAMNSVDKMAAQLNAKIVTNTQVIAINRQQKTVVVGSESYDYDQLVLAVGAQPILPPLTGSAVAQIIQVNNLGDYAHFRKRLDEVTQAKGDCNKVTIGILGAGLIGCEFANDLALQGYRVVVCEQSERCLARLVPPPVSEQLQQQLSQVGVQFNFGVTVKQVEATSGAIQICSADDPINVDIVLAAIGLRPNTTLARAAELAVNRGIIVDPYLRTTDPAVYALGDCAEVAGHVLQFILPLTAASKSLAATLTGNATAVKYPAMPVVVKTPACPLVVCPPVVGSEGEWRCEASSEGIRACFYDNNDQLLGFALTQNLIKQRQQFASQIVPLI